MGWRDTYEGGTPVGSVRSRVASEPGGHALKEEIGRITRQMERQGYVADRAIATAVHLAQRLGKPLLVEGEAGVTRRWWAGVTPTREGPPWDQCGRG